MDGCWWVQKGYDGGFINYGHWSDDIEYIIMVLLVFIDI